MFNSNVMSNFRANRGFRAAGRSSRVYNFARYGTDISEAKDLHQALELARLNFTVGRKKLYYGQNGKLVEMKSTYGVFRLGEDELEFGSCGTDFQPIQNETSFRVCQTLAQAGATWDRAGAENGGATNWVRMKVTDKVILGDTINGFVIARNNHLPGSCFSARAWEERLVCTNGLTAMMPGAILLNMRHTAQVKEDRLMATAERMAETIRQRLEDLQVLAERAAKVRINEEVWESLVAQLMPIPAEATERQQNTVLSQREVLTQSISAPDLANHVENRSGVTVLNGWGALMAVSDFSSHLNDAVRSVSADRATARLSDLAVNDSLLTQARDLVLAMA